MMTDLRVLFATPECAPWVKTGGLGDVSATLPAALHAAGHDIRVLLPAYRAVWSMVRASSTLGHVAAAGELPEATLRGATLPSGVPALLVDSPALFDRPGGAYFDQDGLEWSDSALRFGQLSRVAAALSGPASPLAWRPHVLHCNDWHTGLAPAYLHFAFEPKAATLFLVHNMAYQGNFAPDVVGRLGLPPAAYAVEGAEFHGKLSFLKAGLHFADSLVTVSPTYALEIQYEPAGCGMHGLLTARREKVSGFLNGIDTTAWNPATDTLLPRNYSAATLDDKAACKEALQLRLGLEPSPEAPLLAMVTRLADQKGCDFVLEAVSTLFDQSFQLALLGSGDKIYEDAFVSLAASHPRRVATVIGFNEPLAHLMYAGADVMLMPSRFEPCGLNQMYSQHYGTPPIVRATGGLADTVSDVEVASLADGSATGFVFREASGAALREAILRAIGLYRNPATWRKIQRNGMARSFTWATSARAYAEAYRRLAPSAGEQPRLAE